MNCGSITLSVKNRFDYNLSFLEPSWFDIAKVIKHSVANGRLNPQRFNQNVRLSRSHTKKLFYFQIIAKET